jgi:hypothetical protein
MHVIELPGLDGSNLLAFLAALGTLRVLTLAEPDATVKMSWRDRGFWMPVVHHSRIGDAKTLVDTLADRVCGEQTVNPACCIGSDLSFPAAEYAEFLRTAWNQDDREQLAFLAALGSEFVRTGPKKEQMADTEFRTMSGAGHQHFLGTMVQLARESKAQHLYSSLFVAWTYEDERPNLRWDPADYRPHALRAENPSGDPIRTMRGANRLATEALPFFPTFPRRRGLRTLSFEDRDGHATITWPVWSSPVGAASISALLGLSCVQCTSERDSEREMRSRDIVQLFRAKRFTDGKFRNFSPSRLLL